MTFRQILATELARRRTRSPRYSLRAFARDLGVDHATLSQILRRRRNLTPQMVRLLGRRLGLKPAEIAEACEQQNAETVIRLVASPAFRPDSRWIATRTGLPLDAVNCALQRLIYHGQLVMEAVDRWTVVRSPYA